MAGGTACPAGLRPARGLAAANAAAPPFFIRLPPPAPACPRAPASRKNSIKVCLEVYAAYVLINGACISRYIML